MYGENFQQAYDEWEFSHTVGMSTITGPLYRRRHVTWLGWEMYTPWQVYAIDPGSERYRHHRDRT